MVLLVLQLGLEVDTLEVKVPALVLVLLDLVLVLVVELLLVVCPLLLLVVVELLLAPCLFEKVLIVVVGGLQWVQLVGFGIVDCVEVVCTGPGAIGAVACVMGVIGVGGVAC